MDKQDKIRRRQKLLQVIIQEYIKTARPVSSQTLVDEYDFEYSPATIRNDMAALEEAGFIMHPHTSAGRVPTEKGYQYYIQHFLQPTPLSSTEKKALDELFAYDTPDQLQHMKQIAKTLAELTDETVIISLNNGETIFSSGISHMFRKPEFSHVQTMVSMSEAFDRLDEIMQGINEAMTRTDQDIQILMGKQNPFFNNCAVMITEYEWGNAPPGVVGILGPMRMDYDANIALLEYIETLMDHEHENETEERTV